MSLNNVFHLGLSYSNLNGANIAIVPGDPKRVKKIALLMENPVHLTTFREFTTWYAEINNKPVIICSTGIGGPSTSIVVEELSQLGIRTFLRVGTTGAIQKFIDVGDIIVTTAAVRLDGASSHFAPIEFPAVSDFTCTKILIETAKEIYHKIHVGITVSSDTFYPGQERYNTYSGKVLRRFKNSMQEWKNMGAMNYEMESATLLTMCATQGLRAGMISGVIVNRIYEETPTISIIKNVENIVIKIIVQATRKLIDNI